jgi:phosphoglycerol transferase MdoB-like AlkP superfamily enzyme
MAVLWWSWEGMRQWGLSIVVNLAFLAGNMLLTVVWFALKKIHPTELLSTYIGVGDLLLFSILAIALPYSLFIPFHILSLLAGALLGASVFKHTTVPLAGIQALLLVVLLCGLQCLQLTFSDLEFLML